MGACTGTSTDTEIYVHDAAGTILASNDDSGIGLCSALDYSIPAGGTVYLRVTYWTDGAAIPSYFLFIDFP